jgi:alkanesulfonate monooxygenase SsuD/methylene tetrahydromethanopterin reductase-like flavin-dependent oxidoreductase (luciferase family)
VQDPGVPVWVAASYGKARPLQRAARHDGLFPINLEHPDQLAEMVADVRTLLQDAGKDPTMPYDIVAALPPQVDPAPYSAAGATWWLVEFPWQGNSADQVRSLIRNGPGH